MEDFPFREWLGRMVVRVGHAVIFGWMNRVFPIQAVWQPMGTVSVRSRSSGADTEVRPPAMLLSDPFGATCGWVSIGHFRFRVFCCPIGRVPVDQHPAERTRRSALPPPVIWARRMVCLCGMPIGVFDPRFWAARSFDFHPIQVQRADTEVRAPAVRFPVLMGHWLLRRAERRAGQTRAGPLPIGYKTNDPRSLALRCFSVPPTHLAGRFVACVGSAACRPPSWR